MIRREPIAIVGIGCRFPGGAHDVEAFWSLLASGTDAISEVPKDRFSLERFYDAHPEKPGKTRSRWGGFVEQGVELFDAAFFGMSPREAAYLDPMQRWLLEVSWEAFEDAGIVPEGMAGSDTAVFIGGFTEDIKLLQMDPSNRSLLGPHAATGSAMTMLANRLSYFYDLHGPSVALDTACSSSLVAAHLACQSIWNGESSFALAGGVNAMFRPEYTIAESKAGMLSPDGRSKAFDSRANGYVRGEGAGIVLLEPLSRALAAGRIIYATIRGSAVNQDGRTNGITVPNGHAQQRLIRAACERAEVTPADIQYVEAHGTGTPVGDPIEVNALGSALSVGRSPGRPCWIGSVKTNFGHLEAAAGVAGLIKTALSLQHRQIPAHLHLREPNPAIDLGALGLRVPGHLTDFAEDLPRLASVNSFGFGGTNAHVVLEAAPDAPVSLRLAERKRPALLTLSARSEVALTALTRAYAQRYGAQELELPQLYDLAHSTRQHRGHHEHRLTVRAASGAELRQRLDAASAGVASSGVFTGRRQRGRQGLVFVFSGMGPQWWGMGQGLLAKEPVFRRAVEECDASFRAVAGWSLLDEMQKSEADSGMARTEIAQPASFALQVGLQRLWRSFGVEPSAIVGHSAGEVAAALAAGVYSLEDAVTVIYHRSRLQQRTTGQGKLVALGVSHDEARQALAEYEGRISIAAVNGPRAVTLVGDAASLSSFLKPFEARQVFVRHLQVDVPYHSHYMEPLRSELLGALAAISPEPAATPLFSSVTGERASGPEWDASYWWRNVRQSVLFADAIGALGRDGYDTFLELGAHPVLGSAVAECLAERGSKATVVASLRRKSDEQEAVLDALAALYVSGSEPDFGALAEGDERYVRLPHYPFQREAHWAESAVSRRDRLGAPHHPLLGPRAPSPKPRFNSEISLGRLPYLADHVVRGGVVFPGAGYVEMMLAALDAERAGAATTCELRDITFSRALFLRPEENALLELSLDQTRGTLELCARASDQSEEWQEHASASFRLAGASLGTVRVEKRAASPELSPISREACYAYLASLGLEYGPSFRGIRELWTGPRRAFARVELDAGLEARDYLLHPALLDACFQVMLAATRAEAAAEGGEPRVYLPTRIGVLRVHRAVPRCLWVSTNITEYDERALAGDLTARDEQGHLVLELVQVRARSLENLQPSGPTLEQLLYDVEWRPQPVDLPALPAAEPGAWLVLSDGSGDAGALLSELEALDQRCIKVRFGPSFAADARGFIVDPRNPSHFRSLLADFFANTVGPWRGVLHLCSLDASAERAARDDVAWAEPRGPVALLHCLQALEQTDQPTKLWIVTRGAQAAASGASSVCAPLDAALWGMLRGVAYQEAPQRFGGAFDLDPARPEGELARVAAELVSAHEGDEVAFRGGERQVARFVPRPDLVVSAGAPHFKADGAYLITGGLGGVGMSVARWMVKHGARRLILMGRSPLPPRAEWRHVDPASATGLRLGFVRELEASGATVHLASLDVADEEALRGYLDQYRSEAWPPIRGVVHAAGVSEPHLLSELTQDAYARTARPKVLGAVLLDRLLGQQLELFVLFSSVAAFAFTAGQGDYAAANAVLDALAHDRRRRGLAALSVNFGPWAEAGMATLLGEYFHDRGMTPFPTELGLSALGQLVQQDVTQATVLWISDSRAFRERNFSSTSPVRFIEAVVDPAGEDSTPVQLDVVARIFAGTDLAEQQARALAALGSVVARVLRLGEAELDPESTLSQLGLDSLLALELKNRLLSELQVSFPVIELLRDTTIAQLSRLLHQRLGQRNSAPSPRGPGHEETRLVPLGPNQHWFFARKLPNPHHWNMAALWEVTRRLDGEKLREAVAAVVAHHELLRARFLETPQGWQQRVVAEEATVPCSVVSLASVPPRERSAAIEGHIAERQARLDLFQGPLLEVCYFDFGPREGGRLLTVIHHLVSDVFSQQIVVSDIELAYQQLEQGAALRLPQRSDDFGDWVQRLARYAQRGARREEREYWLQRDWQATPLPLDFENGRENNSIASARVVTASLSKEDTRALLQAAPAVHQAHVLDLLMTAFTSVIHDWSGLRRALLDVIVHGREAPGDDLDLGRTVGLFAHGVPLSLELPAEGGIAPRLAAIRAQLQPFQELARTFAALRWLGEDQELTAHLSALPKRELIFNYIGQFESAQDSSALFRVVPSVPRALEATENQRDFLLQCQVGILNGQLTLLLNYSENAHRRSTVERLAHSMLELLRAFAATEPRVASVQSPLQAS